MVKNAVYPTSASAFLQRRVSIDQPGSARPHRRMVVRENQGSGVQWPSARLTTSRGLNAGAVQRAPETILKANHPMAGIQKQAGKHLNAANAPCDCAEYWRTGTGEGQRGAALEPSDRCRRAISHHRLQLHILGGPNPDARQKAGQVGLHQRAQTAKAGLSRSRADPPRCGRECPVRKKDRQQLASESGPQRLG